MFALPSQCDRVSRLVAPEVHCRRRPWRTASSRLVPPRTSRPPPLASCQTPLGPDVSVEVGDADVDDNSLMRRRKSAVGFAVDPQVVVDGEISTAVAEEIPPQKPPVPGENGSKRY